MPIQFKSKLSSATANATFLDKTIDDETIGVVALSNITNVNSGALITNAQRYINEIADSDGTLFEGDPDRKVYSSTEFIADGDSRKVAIGKVDAALKVVADLVEFGAVKLAEYISDTAFEADQGAAQPGDIYYNSTTGLIRYYTGLTSEWKNVGGGGVANQELIGTGDGLTVDFTLSTVPTSDDSIIVILNGLIVEKTDYTVASTTITFSTAPTVGQKVYAYWLTDGTPASPPITSGSFNVDYLDVDATALSNKEVTLANIPTQPTKVVVDIINGSSQRYGVDYSVTSNVLSWNGLGMDGEIVLSDTLRVIYIS